MAAYFASSAKRQGESCEPRRPGWATMTTPELRVWANEIGARTTIEVDAAGARSRVSVVRVVGHGYFMDEAVIAAATPESVGRPAETQRQAVIPRSRIDAHLVNGLGVDAIVAGATFHLERHAKKLIHRVVVTAMVSAVDVQPVVAGSKPYLDARAGRVRAKHL